MFAAPDRTLPPSFGIMFSCTPPVSRSAPMPLVSATTSGSSPSSRRRRRCSTRPSRCSSRRSRAAHSAHRESRIGLRSIAEVAEARSPSLFRTAPGRLRSASTDARFPGGLRACRRRTASARALRVSTSGASPETDHFERAHRQLGVDRRGEFRTESMPLRTNVLKPGRVKVTV